MLFSTIFGAVAGGVLIGCASGAMMILLGHIAGNSGIAEELLPPWQDRSSLDWRSGYVLGMVLSPLLYALFSGHLPLAEVKISGPMMALAGVLVGFGTAYGHGCTSGHGVSGIARFSGRSIVATSIFMALGMLTTWVVRHQLGIGV